MWLLKTEPSEYAWADLERHGRTVWDGVSNPAALRNLRQMQAGERAIIYHTADEKAAVGIAEVVRPAYPDPKLRNQKRVVVDLAPVARLAAPVTLAAIRAMAVFKDSPLVRQARLSVVPLTPAQWQALAGQAK